MKTTYCIWIFILLLGIQGAKAQVPGFRGKRAAVQVGTYATIRTPLDELIGQNYFAALGKTRIILQPAVHFQYIITRHSLLQLSASTFRSRDTMQLRQYTYELAPFSQYAGVTATTRDSYFERIFTASAQHHMVAMSWMLFTNKNNGALAPFGKYLSFGLGANLTRVLADSTVDADSWSKRMYSGFGRFCMGNQQVLLKRGIIDYGLCFNLIGISALRYEAPPILPDGQPAGELNRYNARFVAQWDIQRSTFISSYINIGGIF